VKVAIAGASGYVGQGLAPRLAAAGHDVVVMGRSAGTLPAGPRISAAELDIGDERALRENLAGADAAVYLVHSMAAGDDFAERDRQLATTFAAAAAAADVGRIVYLGGLGGGDMSDHLASRQEVGQVLASGPVPVVELRAAVVLGSGSISFEMLRYLTERLPVMVCPRWIRTRIQPIAEADLMAHLERALDEAVPPGVYEVGGPEVTTYQQMIASYARVRGLRPRRIIDVGVLTPSLSARWVDLVTPVDRTVSHTLIESLVTEVVVTDGERTHRTFGIDCVGVDWAISQALDQQLAEVAAHIFDLPAGTSEGLYAMAERAELGDVPAATVREGLLECGGDLRWYGVPLAWRLRLALGHLFGERLSLHRPVEVVPGAQVDWWEVERLEPDVLVLGTASWFCGEAWLGFRMDPDERSITQVGVLRPKGLVGVVYWRVLWPIHLVVFELMAKEQVKVKRPAGRPSSPAARYGRRSRTRFL